MVALSSVCAAKQITDPDNNCVVQDAYASRHKLDPDLPSPTKWHLVCRSSLWSCIWRESAATINKNAQRPSESARSVRFWVFLSCHGIRWNISRNIIVPAFLQLVLQLKKKREKNKEKLQEEEAMWQKPQLRELSLQSASGPLGLSPLIKLQGKLEKKCITEKLQLCSKSWWEQSCKLPPGWGWQS